MLLYGCPQPGSQERVWNCGSEMVQDDNDEMDSMETSPVCQSEDKILYAWAHNAPDLQLPEGVGFEVGGDTAVQYLVMQIHYNDHVEDFKSTILFNLDFVMKQHVVSLECRREKGPLRFDPTSHC